MSLDKIKEHIPEYAKDLKLNLSTVSRCETLSQKQTYGCMYACALVSQHPGMAKMVLEDSGNVLEDADVTGAKSAASIMSMNNIYYRFAHMIGDDEIEKMPAKLRMNVIGKPGCDKTDFECWSLAVSVINNCQKCIQAHYSQLQNAGFTKQQIQDIARISSTVRAVAEVLKWESVSL